MRLLLLICFVASTAAAQLAPDRKAAPSDRDYYQQLYDAGGFTPESFATAADGSKIAVGRIRNADYVCFNDDTYSGTFFTFLAWAYDDQYAKASDKQLRSTSSEENMKQWNIQQAIQQGAPYIRFLDRGLLNAYPSDAQKFFRSGGRILEASIYEKGVKVKMLEYHDDAENSWFVPLSTPNPSAYTQTSKTLHLSIESATMRYIESEVVTITVGRGETAATNTVRRASGAGKCEKIPDPPLSETPQH